MDKGEVSFAKTVAAVLITVTALIGLVTIVVAKCDERIKLARIAAATSQYCDCLKLIEVE